MGKLKEKEEDSFIVQSTLGSAAEATFRGFHILQTVDPTVPVEGLSK